METTYNIPQGHEAMIEGDKVIIRPKENEDERIRKALIRMLSGIAGGYPFEKYGIFKKDALSYLEKQKEQKPVPKFSVGDYVKDTNYKGDPLYQIVGIDKECYICEYRGDKNMGDRAVMHFTFDNPYLRLVPEPAEWSEEDEERIKSIKATLEQFAYSNGMLDVNGDYCDASIIKNMNWLKDLHTKVHMQPKQEWSEEDEKMLASFLHKVEVRDLLTNKENVWIVKRLKSLRPSWKPSEEQMEALNKVVNGEVLLTTQHKNLESLYNDLEKLMEE